MIFYARITLYIFHFLTATLVFACKSAPNPKSERITISEIRKSGDSVLVLWSNQTSQLLTAEGQDYEIVPSSDSQSIGINIRLFSNLQIAKVFPRDSTGKFDVDKAINISLIAWKMVEEQSGIDPESILRPKTRIISWESSAKEVLVNVSGTFENGEEFRQDLKVLLPITK